MNLKAKQMLPDDWIKTEVMRVVIKVIRNIEVLSGIGKEVEEVAWRTVSPGSGNN